MTFKIIKRRRIKAAMIEETNKLLAAVALVRAGVDHKRWAEVQLALAHAEECIDILRRLVLEENRKDILREVPDVKDKG